MILRGVAIIILSKEESMLWDKQFDRRQNAQVFLISFVLVACWTDRLDQHIRLDTDIGQIAPAYNVLA
jgi:hypothetical protein